MRHLAAAAILLCLWLAPVRAAPAPDPDVPTELFVIRYEPGTNWKPDRPMSEQGLLEHFHYVKALHAKGLIVLAGPVGPDSGLIVLRARDLAEASRVMAEDPAVTAAIFAGSIQPFTARFVGEIPGAAPPR